MYAVRDAATSLLYSKLKEAGAVEEVFQFFGCSYLEKKEIRYFVTSQEKEFFDFRLQCEQKGIYCTSGINQNYRCKVPKGELQNINSNFQMDTLKILRESYSEKFFQIIGQLVEIPAQNHAEKLFHEWKAELGDCSDEDKLSLFQTTLSMATSMKLLDYPASKKFSSWLQKKKKQLKDDLTIKKGERHTYAGLVCLDCDKKDIKYKVYSQYEIAWQERKKLLQNAFIVSPIITKDLYFNPINFTVVQEKNQHFYSLLKTIMDNSYVSLIKQIYDLPQIVTTEYYENLSEQINSFASQRELDDFSLYGSQLRLNRR